MKKSIYFAGLAASAALAGLAGCGGGSSEAPVARSASGALSVAIHWPNPGRLIPTAAQRITLTLSQPGQPSQQQSVGRSVSTVTFPGLVVGNATLTATAFPNPPSAATPGTAQATGSEIVTVLPGPAITLAAPITMASTIVQISITPTNASVTAGQTTTLAASPMDAAGNVVLVSSADFRWTSLDGSVATVIGSGNQATVTGAAAGNATLAVQEVQSGQDGKTIVLVIPGSVKGATGLAHTPWAKARGDIRNTGRGAATGATGQVIKWNLPAPAGGGVTGSACISPDSSVAIIGLGDGRILGVDVATADILWSVQTGGAVESTPAFGANNVLYIGSDDGNLYALNPATGAKVWVFATNGAVKSSPNIGGDGTVYVGSSDGNLYAVNGNGTKQWAFKTGGPVQSSPAIGADNTIYVGSDDHNLYAVSPAGAKKWAYSTGGLVRSSPCVGDDGAIYVGSWDKSEYAVTSAGALRWSFPTADIIESSAALGYSGQVYFGSDDSKLYGLDGATGKPIWSKPFATQGHVYSSPVVTTAGNVYTFSDSYFLYYVNGTTGAEIWQQQLSDNYLSSPAFGSDGTIYLGVKGGFLALK